MQNVRDTKYSSVTPLSQFLTNSVIGGFVLCCVVEIDLSFSSCITWVFTFTSATEWNKQAYVCKGHRIQITGIVLPSPRKHRKIAGVGIALHSLPGWFLGSGGWQETDELVP